MRAALNPDPPLDRQLDELLSERLQHVIEREKSTFDALATPRQKSIVLFGAGNLGRMTLAGLRKAGIEPLAFSDNNPSLWGGTVEGVPVLSPQAAAERFGRTAVFVVTVWGAGCRDRMSERAGQIEALGCDRAVPFASLFWKYSDFLLPHYILDLPHHMSEQAQSVRDAFALFRDHGSRSEFVAQTRWRMLLDFDAFAPPVEHKAYFPEDVCPLSDHEVLVDCGAFDGDTLREFLELRHSAFERVVAFEPDPVNWGRLTGYVASLPAAVRERIDLRQAGAGGRTEKVKFSVTGTAGSAAGEGSHEIQTYSLDDALGDLDPTWIKMDIEGFEAAALEGARKTIQRSRPVLAINLEHRQDDLWKLPLLLRSLVEDYRFFLRPHLIEGWDLVCYAIPASRCVTR